MIVIDDQDEIDDIRSLIREAYKARKRGDWEECMAAIDGLDEALFGGRELYRPVRMELDPMTDLDQ